MKKLFPGAANSSAQLVAFGIIALLVTGCGVRDNNLSDSTTAAAGAGPVIDPNIEQPTPTLGGDGSVPSFEGDREVRVRFFDSLFSGYWRNDSRDSDQPTEIVRITFGVLYFHVEAFIDQSQGVGSTGLNCFTRESFYLATLTGDGLTGVAADGITVGHREWTVNDSILQSTAFDDAGDVVANSAGTATFSETFLGLSAEDLQVCDGN